MVPVAEALVEILISVVARQLVHPSEVQQLLLVQKVDSAVARVLRQPLPGLVLLNILAVAAIPLVVEMEVLVVVAQAAQMVTEVEEGQQIFPKDQAVARVVVAEMDIHLKVAAYLTIMVVVADTTLLAMAVVAAIVVIVVMVVPARLAAAGAAQMMAAAVTMVVVVAMVMNGTRHTDLGAVVVEVTAE
mgnify:CR=1 FL=1